MMNLLLFITLVAVVHGASRAPRGFTNRKESRHRRTASKSQDGMMGGDDDDNDSSDTGTSKCQEILVRVEGNEILNEQYFWSRGSGNILEPVPQDEYGYNLNLYNVEGTEKVGVVAENLFYLPPGDTGFNCLGREIWTFFDFETQETFGTITDQYECLTDFPAITGGTGNFECASGHVEAIDASEDFPFDDGFIIWKIVNCGACDL